MYNCFVSTLLSGANKILRMNDLSLVSNGEFISFQPYWFMKGFILATLCGIFPVLSWSSVAVIAYLKQLLLVFCGFVVGLLLLTYSGEYMYTMQHV